AVERDRPAAAIPPARRGAVLQLVPFVEFEEQLRADEGGGDEADDGEIFVALGHGRPSIALRRRRRNRQGEAHLASIGAVAPCRAGRGGARKPGEVAVIAGNRRPRRENASRETIMSRRKWHI